MSKIQQTMILRCDIDKTGKLQVTMDFFPKMPTMENYRSMREDRKGCIAVVNKFASQASELIKKMTEIGDDNSLSVRDAVQNTDIGSEAHAQFPSVLPEEKSGEAI